MPTPGDGSAHPPDNAESAILTPAPGGPRTERRDIRSGGGARSTEPHGDPDPVDTRKRQRWVRIYGLMIADALALSAAYCIAYLLVAGSPTPGELPGLTLAALLTFPIWFVVFAANGLYASERRRLVAGTMDEVVAVMTSLLAGGMIFVTLTVLLPSWGPSTHDSVLIVTAAIGVALLLDPLARGLARDKVLPIFDQPRRVLIVGSGQVANLVHRKIAAHPEFGLNVVGFVEDDGNEVPGALLGRPEDLRSICERLRIDHVIIAFKSGGHEELLDLIRSVRRPTLQVSIVPRAFEGFSARSTLDDLAGLPIVTLPSAYQGQAARVLKRSFDIVVAGLGLVLLAPAMLAIAAAIKIDSPGPVFFVQDRRGRHGRVFRIVKFRSMEAGAERRRFDMADLNEVDGVLFKVKDDPRVTRVGAWIRRNSLDELPQLWNVLRGDMSLVGPRPFVLHEADEINGWAARRLEATPGLTGLWQILGRNDLSYDEMVRLDYLYATGWSLGTDIKILLKTIPVVLRKRGAY